MVLPIIAGGAAGYGAYKLIKALGEEEKVDPYKPDEEKFKYQGTGEFALQQRGEEAAKRAAPQADYTKYNEGRGMQMGTRGYTQDAIDQYRKQINNPNTAAQNLLKGASASNFRQQLAAARQGGFNPAAMRSAMQTSGVNQATTAQQSGMLQAQETQAALQGYAQAAAQQRAQDLQLMGLDAQTAQYQAMLELQQGALNDKVLLGMYGLGQNASMADLNAGMGYENLMGGNVMGAQYANAQSASADNAAMAGMIGAGMSAGATYGASQNQPQKPPPPSDEASKQKIQEVESENNVLRDLMATLGFAPAKAERKQMQKPPEYKGQYRYPEARDAADIAEAERRFRMQNRAALGQQAMEEIRRKQLAETYQQDVEQQRGFEESYYSPQAEAVLSGEHPGFVAPRPGEKGVPQPIVTPPSDERSKDRIAELEGLVEQYERMRDQQGDNLIGAPGREPIYPEHDYSKPPTARFADIPAKSWEYGVEPFATQYPGRHVGPTTQDLKANPATAGTVYTGPDGYDRPEPTLLGLSNTAAISEMARIQQDQEERIRAYEQMSQGRALSEDQMRRLR